ncbi:hypothetical protein ABG768_020573 [Culter alburnus]|uniref:Uncharacterized protein n=1 Tax=Culter alburnus TaxID=194366 RepID=A0AAW2B205_CULAL
MPLLQGLLMKLHALLTISALFSSLPLNILLIGLEALLDQYFSCPCKVHQNGKLTVFIFIGPALFTFCLMFLYLRPFRHEWFHCPDPEKDDTQKNWPKVLISCLVPPVMWIFLLFLDGDYFACGMTDWDGCYVFNKKMNMSWCHPFPEGNNMWCNTSSEEPKNPSSEDHEKMCRTLEYFHESQFIGYCMISVFSVLAIVFVGIYDCFVTGKCDRLPNQLLCCCGRRLPDHCTQTADSQGEGNSSISRII